MPLYCSLFFKVCSGVSSREGAHCLRLSYYGDLKVGDNWKSESLGIPCHRRWVRNAKRCSYGAEEQLSLELLRRAGSRELTLWGPVSPLSGLPRESIACRELTGLGLGILGYKGACTQLTHLQLRVQHKARADRT